MMEAIDRLGIFWLAGYEADTLSGRVLYDPKDGRGIRLSLVGRFDQAASDDGEPRVRILGWLDSDRITLDRCFSTRTINRIPGVSEAEYYANQLFIGHHCQEDEPAFQSVTIELDNLDAWVNESGIQVEENLQGADAARQPIYRASFTPLPEQYQAFSRGTVGLAYYWKSHGDPIRGVGMKQWPVFIVKYSEMQALKVIHDDVRRLQYLAILCMDASTEVDRLTLQRSDVHVKMLSGEVSSHEQPIEFVAPPIRHVDSAERERRRRHPMLLTFEELGGLTTIARWLDTSRAFQRALDSLMSTKRVDQMFAENRFLNATFAAEAFHRTTQGGQYMPQDQFVSLLKSYAEITPAEHQQWLQGRLAHGNELTLRTRLKQLATYAPTAAQQLVGKMARWVDTMVKVRNELTHAGPGSRTFDGSHLVNLSESVYDVVRVCMLIECGVGANILTIKAGAPEWEQRRRRVSAAVEGARRQFK